MANVVQECTLCGENRDKCQMTRKISRRNEITSNNILEVEIFDVLGIGFMGLFPSFYNQQYILVAVYYMSKSVEVMALPLPRADDSIYEEKHFHDIWNLEDDY